MVTMRAAFAVVILSLAACGPRVPDSGAGVGFTDYNSYVRQRAAASATAPNPYANPGPPVSEVLPPPPAFSTDIAASAIAEAEGSALPAQTASPQAPLDPMALASGDRARGNAPAGIQETTAEMGFVTGGVSDEQDFQAVAGRETIESDKARIEANRAQYIVVQPGALPVRPGETGPNIAAYAVATNNPVGVKLYDRPAFYMVNVKAACSKYTSPDLAQQAFLAADGPQRDRKGLDPDGDGFACDWDPRPFRAALQ